MKQAVQVGFIVWFVLIHPGLFAQTKTVVMGVYDWEPYVSESQENHGILSEIIVDALEKVGYGVIAKDYPFARAMTELKNGSIDILPGVSYNSERSSAIEFSKSIFDIDMVFVFKKGKINYKTISDLKNHIGGIMAGTFWAQELESEGIKYETVATQEQNIKKLVSGRIDFSCMPREVALNLMTRLGENPAQYDFILFKKDGQPAGISKKTKFVDLLKDFEKGMEIIRKDGTYDKVVSKK